MAIEFIEHVADVQFRARGTTLEEMFCEAARALFETIRGTIVILGSVEKTFTVEGEDLERLLYVFLEEFLYLLDAEGFLVREILSLKINTPIREGEKYLLTARVVGDAARNYTFTNDVKAVTYNSMYVRQEEGGTFSCQVVLDV